MREEAGQLVNRHEDAPGHDEQNKEDVGDGEDSLGAQGPCHEQRE